MHEIIEIFVEHYFRFHCCSQSSLASLRKTVDCQRKFWNVIEFLSIFIRILDINIPIVVSKNIKCSMQLHLPKTQFVANCKSKSNEQRSTFTMVTKNVTILLVLFTHADEITGEAIV